MAFYISDDAVETAARLLTYPKQKPWREPPKAHLANVTPIRRGAVFRGKDISGKKFNLLTARRAIRLNAAIYWECDCSCGRHATVNGGDLRSGKTKSCGCLMNKPRVDMVGLQFGKLTVIADIPRKNGRKDHLWKCRCNCGNNILVRGQSLRTGNTTSCGCHRQHAAEIRVQRQPRKSDGKFLPHQTL